MNTNTLKDACASGVCSLEVVLLTIVLPVAGASFLSMREEVAMEEDGISVEIILEMAGNFKCLSFYLPIITLWYEMLKLSSFGR